MKTQSSLSLVVVVMFSALALPSVGLAQMAAWQTPKECSNEQKLFEKELQKRPPFQIPEIEGGLQSSCVRHSMRMFEAWVETLGKSGSSRRRVFAHCPNEDAEVQRIIQTPCKTREYVARLIQDYNVVMDCLAIPPRQFYPFVSVESGFLQNAFAPGEDVGLGQLTPPAIEDVNRRWSDLQRRVSDSPKASCRAMAPYMKQMKVETNDPQLACAFVASPQNPLRNLLYSAAFYLINQDYFLEVFRRNEVIERVEALIKRNFERDQVETLARHLSMIAYNMGVERVSGLLLDYLVQQEGGTKALQNELVGLRDKISALESELHRAQDDLSLAELRKKRELLASLKQQSQEKAEQLRRPILSPVDFDFARSKKSGFALFLKDQGAARYLDLVSNRITKADQVVGPGVCTDSDLTRPLFQDIRGRFKGFLAKEP